MSLRYSVICSRHAKHNSFVRLTECIRVGSKVCGFQSDACSHFYYPTLMYGFCYGLVCITFARISFFRIGRVHEKPLNHGICQRLTTLTLVLCTSPYVYGYISRCCKCISKGICTDTNTHIFPRTYSKRAACFCCYQSWSTDYVRESCSYSHARTYIQLL